MRNVTIAPERANLFAVWLATTKICRRFASERNELNLNFECGATLDSEPVIQ